MEIDVATDPSLQTMVTALEHGTEVVVTRDGKPVARLVKTVTRVGRAEAEAAMRGITEISFRNTLEDGVTIRDLVDDGRRY